MNETIRSIMERRSIRRYGGAALERATIETLLRAGMAAPSASNRQPWELLVVTERDAIDRLADAHPHANMLREAPACIVVCGNTAEAPDFWMQDCAAVTENILVAAVSLGLGTCWCGVHPRKERAVAVAKALGLPDGIVPLNLIAVGHPAEEPPVKDKWQPGRVHWEKW